MSLPFETAQGWYAVNIINSEKEIRKSFGTQEITQVYIYMFMKPVSRKK